MSSNNKKTIKFFVSFALVWAVLYYYFVPPKIEVKTFGRIKLNDEK